MRYESRQDRLDNNYRKVEAMYRKGLSIDDMARQTGLDAMDIYDITQKIFAIDMKKASRVG